MNAAWVAAGVRARQLVLRTAGPEAARATAVAATWEEAREVLARTVYGERMDVDAERAAAKRSAYETTAWFVRVMAGWLPPSSTSLARLAAAPIEMVNVSRHLAALAGVEADGRIDLGSLGVVSHRLVAASTPAEVRALLTRSVWGDPGADAEPAITFGLHVAWARRALHAPPIVRPWAESAGAVLLARERFVFDRPIASAPARDLDRLLRGRAWRTASSLEELPARLPPSARAALVETGSGPSEFWRAEVALLRRITDDATRASRSGRSGPDAVAGLLALLLIDLWRITAAIEAAGGGGSAPEVFDAAAA